MSSSPEMDRWMADRLLVAQAELIVATEQMRAHYEQMREQYPILRDLQDPFGGQDERGQEA